jgi:hypothetical protein
MAGNGGGFGDGYTCIFLSQVRSALTALICTRQFTCHNLPTFDMNEN